MRRLHGRAIERAFQTGEDVISCFHHGEESYYGLEKPLEVPDEKPEERPDSTT